MTDFPTGYAAGHSDGLMLAVTALRELAKDPATAHALGSTEVKTTAWFEALATRLEQQAGREAPERAKVDMSPDGAR